MLRQLYLSVDRQRGYLTMNNCSHTRKRANVCVMVNDLRSFCVVMQSCLLSGPL